MHPRVHYTTQPSGLQCPYNSASEQCLRCVAGSSDNVESVNPRCWELGVDYSLGFATMGGERVNASSYKAGDMKACGEL